MNGPTGRRREKTVCFRTNGNIYWDLLMSHPPVARPLKPSCGSSLTDSVVFDQQLKGQAPMPAPPRPNTCDACAAKDKQAGQTLGTSCPPPSSCPEFCEQVSDG